MLGRVRGIWTCLLQERQLCSPLDVAGDFSRDLDLDMLTSEQAALGSSRCCDYQVAPPAMRPFYGFSRSVLRNLPVHPALSEEAARIAELCGDKPLSGVASVGPRPEKLSDQRPKWSSKL